jgi:hypothetical protein
VSVVRFCSIHLNTLLASPTRGPPTVVVGPATTVGPASGQGRCLVLEKFVGCIDPTSIYNRYISVRYSGIQKKLYIYINT